MGHTTDKYQVYGESGGTFSNLKEAKACAKAASMLTDDKTSEVWLIADGCHYIDYINGKCVRDGWANRRAAGGNA